MALTKEQILEAQDIQREEVEVPEWGGTVYVKSLSGADLGQYEAALAEMGANGTVRRMRVEQARVMLATLTICDWCADYNICLASVTI